LLVSYLLGSLPTAFLVGKIYKGLDIREHGSGNVGATNTFRVLGRGAGILVLAIDILKGILPVTLIADAVHCDPVAWRVLLGILAVVGHNWTVFLRFQGGKGMATSLGVLIGLAIVLPALGWVLLICLLTWSAMFFSTGYVSLASMVASILFPFAMMATGQPAALTLYSIVLCLFVVLRHRANLRRLMKGEESRVRFKFFKKK